jgi:uncharacterized protein (TIGR03067 family)
MKARALLVVACALLVAADDAADKAAKQEVAKLQGTWKATTLEYNGKDIANKYPIQLVFKDDLATVGSSKEVEKEYTKITFKPDPSTDPKCVDLIIAAGIQKDAKLEGIYKIKDDELTICAKVFGMERPTEFASKEGSSIVLIVLKKEK